MQGKEKKFCLYCGREIFTGYHQGKNRFHCQACNKIFYENPLPAVAAVVENDKKEILLVKRSVNPGRGEWGLPGGFVEIDESIEEAILRELAEETGLKGKIVEFIDVFSQISEFYGPLIIIGYRVKVEGGELSAGDEAEEVKYFNWNSLPKLAFPSHQRLIELFVNKNI